MMANEVLKSINGTQGGLTPFLSCRFYYRRKENKTGEKRDFSKGLFQRSLGIKLNCSRKWTNIGFLRN